MIGGTIVAPLVLSGFQSRIQGFLGLVGAAVAAELGHGGDDVVTVGTCLAIEYSGFSGSVDSGVYG